MLSVLSPALMGGSPVLAEKPDESEMLLQKLLDKEISGEIAPSSSRPEIYLHIGEQVKKVEDGHLSSFKAESKSAEGVKPGTGNHDGNCLLYVRTEESPDKIRILAKLNGFEKGTIDIFVTSSEFSIKGFEASQIRDKTQKQELMSAQKNTAFERTFSLPHQVETKSARAVFHGGEIEVLLPKQSKPGEAM